MDEQPLLEILDFMAMKVQVTVLWHASLFSDVDN